MKSHLSEGRDLEQGKLDSILNKIADVGLPKGLDRYTLQKVVERLALEVDPCSSEKVAESLGISRITARRYLEYLAQERKVRVELIYRPIVEPADLKGLKIRTPKSPFRMEVFQAMGAAPTPTGYADLFLSLQQKVVDGLELPVYDIFIDSFYDVQKYLSLTNHVYTPCYSVVKEQWWQSLPADIRTGLQKAADDSAAYTRESNVQVETEYTQKLKDKGMKVNEVNSPAFRQLMEQTVWKKNESQMGDLIKRVVETK